MEKKIHFEPQAIIIKEKKNKCKFKVIWIKCINKYKLRYK